MKSQCTGYKISEQRQQVLHPSNNRCGTVLGWGVKTAQGGFQKSPTDKHDILNIDSGLLLKIYVGIMTLNINILNLS